MQDIVEDCWPQLSFAIDRGGTFTDVVVQVASGAGAEPHVEAFKLLSRNPGLYPDAPSEGIARALRRHGVGPYTEEGKISTKHIHSIRMGTTVATNALLERNGARTALFVSRGFRDLLEIGNQARPSIFALNIQKPHQLYETVVEVDERVRVVTAEEIRLLDGGPPPSSWHQCSNGHWVELLHQLNEATVLEELKLVCSHGITSIAVAFMHSYIFPDHEEVVRRLATEAGILQCSVSSELASMIKYVPRTTTASVDAAVTPLIAEYIQGFRGRFHSNLAGVDLLWIQSDGGLADAGAFYGFRAVLSGPAGGVVGCSLCTSHQLGEAVQIVGYDMGGTSTDVCRCDGSRLEHVIEAEIGGATVLAPQVDVRTVAAGGGSILRWADGLYHVGPGSAGAYPGPACYGRGGPLTITDANLVLGRIQPQHFPHVFGERGDAPLDVYASRKLFESLAAEVSADVGRKMSVEEVAFGFVDVSNEAMSRPIRNLTEARGYRCDEHVLTVFGGAGGQHACAIAKKLGIRRIYMNRFASMLSAVGICLSDVTEEAHAHCGHPLSERVVVEQITPLVAQLSSRVHEMLQSRGSLTGFTLEALLHLRFDGTSTTIILPFNGAACASIESEFMRRYKAEFGFVLKNRTIMIDDLRVRGLGHSAARKTFLGERPRLRTSSVENPPQPLEVVSVFFDSKWHRTPVYNATPELAPVQGPALIVGEGTTLVLDPTSVATFASDGSILVETDATMRKLAATYDPLTLSVFAHRFMSIAEQMGNALQRTSISTNIKERLDFSCAIFDPQGNLVANAPHIPVHLGAMGAAVLFQKEYWGEDWKPGESVVSNHPSCGGSHLPDITVMTPYHHDGEVLFYVASRGHHADIGGSTPGSMPPFSTSIGEEGAAIKAFKLVDADGVFQEQGITEILMAPGKLPGMSGCRTLNDVLSDLKAQVAANHRGIELVRDLIAAYGAEVVVANMKYIQEAAESAVRQLLRGIARNKGAQLSFDDAMDDGTVIAVDITINESTGSATFDFSRSGDQVATSTNCPTAVVKSALIYVMRCLVGHDIPLNQGCMVPLEVVTRPRSILAPDDDRAVVAGNVLTSQRITDVILCALDAAACSQGCMNNFLMGTADLAYYETICGGAGAGPTFHGASAVQTHMTNTRITDPEILEVKFPVLLRRFEVRQGSGGQGSRRGGNGVIREFVFLKSMEVTVLSERRVLSPRGLHGGADGAKGCNRILRATGDGAVELTRLRSEFLTDPPQDAPKWKNIDGKCQLQVNCGDHIAIETPGGGGFGDAQAAVASAV